MTGEPESRVEDIGSEERDVVEREVVEREDFEAPGADFAEQHVEITDDEDAVASTDWEANAADAIEQSRAVPLGDEEYR